MKRVMGATMALAIAFGGFAGGSLAAQTSGSKLTPVGERAFQDVTTCLTSGKTKTLDVFYLIDNSGSLSYTDEKEVRTEVLRNSLSELGNFTSAGVSVSFAAATFSSGVVPIQGWTELESADKAKVAAEKMAQKISNNNLDGYTNWEKGLDFASKQLTSRGDACKMLIWFTDGGINPDGTVAARISSLKALCHSDVSATNLARKTGSYGLFSRMRAAEISIFGVLYQNDASALEFYNSPTGRAESAPLSPDERLELEHYLMSFMLPLIEGSGVVLGSGNVAGLPKGGPLQCGELDEGGSAPAGQPNGAFLNAEDPIALAFQFLKLETQIGGGSTAKILDGKFNVAPGTAAFRVITSGKSWTLKGPEGSEFRSSSNSVGKAVVIESSGAQMIDVDIEGDQSLLGSWEFDSGDSYSELFVFSGLTIELDRDKTSKVVSQRSNTLTGEALRVPRFANLPVDLSIFEKKNLSLEVLSNGERVKVSDVNVEISDAGQFKVENFKPTLESGELQLWLTLDLGGDFQPITSTFNLEVVEKTAIAVPESDVILLSALSGPDGKATGSITVVGPTAVESAEFCLAQEATRTEDIQTDVDKTDRSASFSWAFSSNDAASSGQNCFIIAQGQTAKIDVSVENPTQANSHVVSMRTMKSTAGSAIYEAPMRFEFDTETQRNDALAYAVISGLLLLGILVPLLLLYLFNRLTTKFLPLEGSTRAEYPVIISADAGSAFLDGRVTSAGAKLQVGPQDFLFTSGDSSASINTGRGNAVARVPLFPLRTPWYEWQAIQGSRVLSMYSGEKSAKAFASGKATEISPSMADNWMVSFSDDELRKPAGEAIAGTLVVYSHMGDLNTYQNRVNKITSTPGIADRVIQLKKAVADDGVKRSEGKTEKARKKSNASVGALPLVPGTTSDHSLPGQFPSGQFAPSSGSAATNIASDSGQIPTPGLAASEPRKPGKYAPPPPPGV